MGILLGSNNRSSTTYHNCEGLEDREIKIPRAKVLAELSMLVGILDCRLLVSAESLVNFVGTRQAKLASERPCTGVFVRWVCLCNRGESLDATVAELVFLNHET